MRVEVDQTSVIQNRDANKMMVSGKRVEVDQNPVIPLMSQAEYVSGVGHPPDSSMEGIEVRGDSNGFPSRLSMPLPLNSLHVESLWLLLERTRLLSYPGG